MTELSWLEKLFADSQNPERIDVRIASGKQYEKVGPSILSWDYRSAKIKASKSKLIDLVNEINAATQHDCDVQRKSSVYAILAWNFSEPYERYLMLKQPGTIIPSKEKPSKYQEQKQELATEISLGLLDRMDRVIEQANKRIKEQDEMIIALINAKKSTTNNKNS